MYDRHYQQVQRDRRKDDRRNQDNLDDRLADGFDLLDNDDQEDRPFACDLSADGEAAWERRHNQ